MPALLDMLNNRKNPLRFWPAEALRQGWGKSDTALAINEYGYKARGAIPALKKLLEDPAFKARDVIIEALKNMGDEETIEAH